MFHNDKPLLKPAQYAEQMLVTAILDGTWPPGSFLPGERTLSQQLTVTRQTVREVLQRLAKDRWITIQHGKPTVVNHYWTEGGLGILKTLVKFTEYLPHQFVTHLLQARAVFLPACARTAVPGHADDFLAHLDEAEALGESALEYAAFDWKLQSMMADLSSNMIYPLILNDFAPVFKALGENYFTLQEGRAASARYYEKLIQAIHKKTDVEIIVHKAMEKSLQIWENVQTKQENHLP